MLGNRRLANLAIEACVDSYVEYGVLSVAGNAMPRFYSLKAGNAVANIYKNEECAVGRISQPINPFLDLGPDNKPSVRENMFSNTKNG